MIKVKEEPVYISHGIDGMVTVYIRDNSLPCSWTGKGNGLMEALTDFRNKYLELRKAYIQRGDYFPQMEFIITA